MNTIQYTEIKNYWNNKVIIDELKEYKDSRGMLCEVWRSDDDRMNNEADDTSKTVQMSYWSTTEPFVLRGPHEHSKAQADGFISWKSSMVYQLYNKDCDEMKYFVTNPNKIYRLKVCPGIVHSYRNIGIVDALTGNFPTSLFMGKNKEGFTSTEKIDEIRHEHIVTPSKNIWIFGAGGRLGKAIIRQLFYDMGYHKYNVIPIYEKFEDNTDTLNKVLENILKHKTDNDIIINCIAKSNVQDIFSNFEYPNVIIPKLITKFCLKHSIYFLHFSTDYVYQTGEVSPYTVSKQNFEFFINNSLLFDELSGYRLTHIEKYVKIIRLSNLFSLDKTDLHNAIVKIHSKFIENTIKVPKDLIIMPTSVEKISEYISNNYVHRIDEMPQYLAITGKCYNIYEIKNLMAINGDVNIVEVNNVKVNNNTQNFLNNSVRIELDCDEHITTKIKDL